MVVKTVMDVIKARKSIRAFQDKPIPKDVVKAIMEAARYAPTARNAQELEYKVITGKPLIEKLSSGIAAAMQKEGMPFMGPPGAKPDFFHGAPLLLIVTAPKDNMWAAADAGLAMQNVMLYAASVDLGSCFIGMAKLIEKDKNLLKLVHIADNMAIVAAMICGYPAENPAPKEKKLTVEYFE
jgi:nitroreductase